MGKEPYYDAINRVWKLDTELGIEEGDAIYIASEYVKGALIYPFHDEHPDEATFHSHVHDFASVVEFLLRQPQYFSIVGFEEYYSQQEIELLDELKKKLHIGELKKNSQLLGPKRIKDIDETEDSYNHMIAPKNVSANSNIAYLSCDGKYTIFEFRKHIIRFVTSSRLEYYTEVKAWEHGYIVVMAKYEGEEEVEEEYIDLVPILKNLYFDVEEFLGEIKEVRLWNIEGGICLGIG